jgi:hypothetical protein
METKAQTYKDVVINNPIITVIIGFILGFVGGVFGKPFIFNYLDIGNCININQVYRDYIKRDEYNKHEDTRYKIFQLKQEINKYKLTQDELKKCRAKENETFNLLQKAKNQCNEITQVEKLEEKKGDIWEKIRSLSSGSWNGNTEKGISFGNTNRIAAFKEEAAQTQQQIIILRMCSKEIN